MDLTLPPAHWVSQFAHRDSEIPWGKLTQRMFASAAPDAPELSGLSGMTRSMHFRTRNYVVLAVLSLLVVLLSCVGSFVTGNGVVYSASYLTMTLHGLFMAVGFGIAVVVAASVTEARKSVRYALVPPAVTYTVKCQDQTVTVTRTAPEADSAATEADTKAVLDGLSANVDEGKAQIADVLLRCQEMEKSSQQQRIAELRKIGIDLDPAPYTNGDRDLMMALAAGLIVGSSMY